MKSDQPQKDLDNNEEVKKQRKRDESEEEEDNDIDVRNHIFMLFVETWKVKVRKSSSFFEKDETRFWFGQQDTDQYILK